MANILGAYDPIFYASEALLWLQKALGLANRVHRGYDKSPQQRGSTIQIRRPSTFLATAVDTTTGGTTQSLETEYVDVKLDGWYEVKYRLSDAELSYTGQQVIEEHVMPAAYAIADKIDQDLAALFVNVPWATDISGTPAVSDITAARQTLFDNLAPLSNEARNHIMIDGATEAGFLNLEAFTQYQGSGDMGTASQMGGQLGQRYGFNIFSNQNTPSHTTGAMTDTDGTLSGAGSKGDTTITVADLGATDTVTAGDHFVIAGNTQRYVATAPATAATGTITNLPIYPALVQDYPDTSAVTFDVPASAAVQSQNLAFVRDWAALAMAPLPDVSAATNAVSMSTVQDPVTGLSVRASMGYDIDRKSMIVSLDALWGVQILNDKLCCRMRRTVT